MTIVKTIDIGETEKHPRIAMFHIIKKYNEKFVDNLNRIHLIFIFNYLIYTHIL